MAVAEKMADTRRRVKLYVLNEERQWDDKGTGHVSSCLVDRMNGMCLLVRSEADGTILLESKIQPDTAYQKQQETLIVWSENDNYDLALSFQEKAGCDEIWEIICQIQGKDPSVDITQDIVEESEEERFDEMPDLAPPIELPPCELSKLEEISELFRSNLSSPIRREKLAIAIESDNYISRLLELFRMSEDLENLECLHHLYEIIKNTILLNRTFLLEILFSDEHIQDVIGCLEFDPGSPVPQRHREYLNSQANFREVLPITNHDLLNKIHQTYKVQYIQDVILPTPSVFEENMLSTLSSFIFFNKVDIVNMIQEDEHFLPELFSQLKEESTEDARRKELVLFLKEFCTFAQSCQNRENFFQTLSNLGILPALEVVFQTLDDTCTRQAAIDIFAHIVEFSPWMVREFIVSEGNTQDDDNLLINLIIEQMICDTDPDLGCAVQLMNILRILIDPENMVATITKTEKTIFLSFFYKHCMHALIAPLLANTTDSKPSKDDYQTAQLLSLILEILTFCVEHHTYHVKNYIISKDILRRVLVLLKSSHQFLVLCALRFMRRIIGLRDDYYNRYIIKGNLLKPVVSAFKTNGSKYNLLNSALIEFFEFIRIEDIKALVCHLGDTYDSDFDGVNYVNTFQGLKQKYEQHLDRLNNKPSNDNTLRQGSILHQARYRRDARSMDEEEEAYFDQDEETEDDVVVRSGDNPFRNAIVDGDVDSLGRFIDKKDNELLKDVKNGNGRPDGLVKSPLSNSPTKNLSPTVNTPPRPLSPSGIRPGTPFIDGLAVNANKNKVPESKNVNTNNAATNNTKTGDPTSNTSQAKSNSVPNKGSVVGLVDYPDEDSDEDEEEDEENHPPSKRARYSL